MSYPQAIGYPDKATEWQQVRQTAGDMLDHPNQLGATVRQWWLYDTHPGTSVAATFTGRGSGFSGC